MPGEEMDYEVVDRLLKLSELHESGALSSEEFAAAKDSLLRPAAANTDTSPPGASPDAPGRSRRLSLGWLAVAAASVLVGGAVAVIATSGGDEEAAGSKPSSTTTGSTMADSTAPPLTTPPFTLDEAAVEAEENACRTFNIVEADAIQAELDELVFAQRDSRAVRMTYAGYVMVNYTEEKLNDITAEGEARTSEWLKNASLAGSDELEAAFEEAARTYSAWVDAQLAFDEEATVRAHESMIPAYTNLIALCAAT